MQIQPMNNPMNMNQGPLAPNPWLENASNLPRHFVTSPNPYYYQPTSPMPQGVNMTEPSMSAQNTPATGPNMADFSQRQVRTPDAPLAREHYQTNYYRGEGPSINDNITTTVPQQILDRRYNQGIFAPHAIYSKRRHNYGNGGYGNGNGGYNNGGYNNGNGAYNGNNGQAPEYNNQSRPIFNIIRPVGAVGEPSAGNWLMELNVISWNSRPSKYDLREWAPNHVRSGRGVTLTLNEMLCLFEVLSREIDEMQARSDFTQYVINNRIPEQLSPLPEQAEQAGTLAQGQEQGVAPTAPYNTVPNPELANNAMGPSGSSFNAQAAFNPNQMQAAPSSFTANISTQRSQ